MSRAILTKRAREDLIEIWLHIAEDDSKAADRVLDDLNKAIQELCEHPKIGAARNDIRTGLRYRVCGSYLLLYRITDTGVEIVRAVHGRRDLFGLF